MLILIILAAAGVSVLSFGVKKLSSNDYLFAQEQKDFSAEIADLKKMQPEGYEKDIKIYEYLNAQKVKPGSWQAVFALNIPDSIPQE